MAERPSGTVTFLFTDIEGSTRRWEADADAMRVGLASHDEVLRSAVEGQGGWLFKHTGDGVCAAFSSAPDAVAAAVDAQRRLTLPVRMGIVTGAAEVRDGDYFGPVLNRAARVMAAAHGGQIVLSAVTAGLADGADLVDLGVHRLRDLSGEEHLFQARADGLRSQFPALRTIDAVPGNLPIQTTSFVGRELEVKELAELMRAHRLVTLTGVGGVGKTRLAVQVAAGMTGEFPDGVWLVELAPVGDPAALPDAVATALGITPQAGRPVVDRIVEALAGRQLLVVLDNCEHLLDAAAELVEAVLARTASVKVLATSREGLRIGGEQLWVVPSLALDGPTSEAVTLFEERAVAVNARFSLDDLETAEAVALICRRLDGIPLAIELAAARMVSMSALDVQDRLGDRFQLLAGGRRGLERHQTLRQAVAWSFDLLDENETFVLNRCAVFAGGFSLAAAAQLCQPLDEYVVLDVLDSLVRKSLVTVEQVYGHARYGMYETIRQFAEEQLAVTDNMGELRDVHARHFAAQAVRYSVIWDGPRQREALDWVDVEFANLRAGFRWAADHHDLDAAATIAAHTPLISHLLQRYESIGWAIELLDTATGANLPQLARLYGAASLCFFLGQPDDSVRYAQAALALEADPRYDGFRPPLNKLLEAAGHCYAARIEQAIEICFEVADRPGPVDLFCLALLFWLLTAVGRDEEARTLAEETLTEESIAAARHRDANPHFLVGAFAYGYGRGYAQSDPPRALRAFRKALVYCQEHRLIYTEAQIAYSAAGVEASHGDPDRALDLFDLAIDGFHRSGDLGNLFPALGSLAVHFDRVEQPDLAARIYGASTHSAHIAAVPGLQEMVQHLRTVLGDPAFDQHVADGAAMETGDAVAYARQQIRLADPMRTSPTGSQPSL